MYPVIISNDMIARLPDWIPMYSSHIVILQLPGQSKQAKQIHILPKMKTDPLTSLGVLCDDGCNTTLDKQYTSVQKTLTRNNKRYQNQSNWNVGSSPGNTTIRRCEK